MSVKQSNTSNLSLPSTDTPNRVSDSGNATAHISKKEIVGTILLTIISVSMIVIGSMYLQQCPAGKYIPVYLLVGGLMGLLKPLLSISTGSHSDPNDQTVLRQALMDNSSKSSSLIMCFMLCWFFIGSYWIYNIYEPQYGKDCNKTLYLFAFWLVTSVYLTVAIVLGIIFVVLLIKTCKFFIVILSGKHSETPETPVDV